MKSSIYYRRSYPEYYQTNDLNFQREYSGLVEAMKFFQINEGTIVTLNQKDVFEKDGFTVKLIPAHEFLI